MALVVLGKRDFRGGACTVWREFVRDFLRRVSGWWPLWTLLVWIVRFKAELKDVLSFWRCGFGFGEGPSLFSFILF